MSSVALFVALGGGAYAISVPKNSVGARELRRGAVTTSKVRNHSLRATDLKRGLLPALGGVRATDVEPPPTPGTVIHSVDLELKASGEAFVLGTVRDVFLTCGAGACSGQWGIYVDNRPVHSTGMTLHADSAASDGFGFYTLFGLTDPLPRGHHTVTLAQTTGGAAASVGQLGAQLAAVALAG